MPAYPESDLLLQRFYSHVNSRPDDPYLHQPMGGGQVRTFSLAEAFDQASRMAAHLKSLDLPRQSKIAIVSKNTAHFILAELAIWMAGHVTVALYPTLAADTVGYILEHSESRLLFVGKLDTWAEMRTGVPDQLPKIAIPLGPDDSFPSWDAIVASTEPIGGQPTRAGTDESLIIYTSGSTGQPKGVLHTFETISAPTRSLASTLRVDHHERVLSYLPLAHAMDRWLSECLSLWAGSQVFFAEALNTFVQDLGRAKPTLFVSVPRLWLKFQLGVYAKMPKSRLDILLRIPLVNRLIKRRILTSLGLEHVRFAGSGSAPIPGELIQWYRDLGLELLEGYGMSENFNFSHMSMPGRGRVGYIGHPHPGVECKLSDQGEILVKSPGTMVGYYKAPELTAEVMTEDGFLKTGDRGEIDEDGRLKITGRVKELFKTSKGKYVAPVPIENILNNDPNIELSIVSGSGCPCTHAVVQLAENLRPKVSDPAVRARITAELDKLLDHANGQIEEYEEMGFIAVARDPWTIEDGQLTPTMKIKRGVIEQQYADKLDAWYASKQRVIWE